MEVERATGKSFSVCGSHSQVPGERQQPRGPCGEAPRSARRQEEGELWASTLLWCLWEGTGEQGEA